MAVEVAATTMSAHPHPADRIERSAPDRFMRRMLRISETTAPDTGIVDDAHRAFRTSLVVSGLRCLISYVLIPVLVPLLSFAGVLAAPVGIGLCAIAVVNGIVSLRRFWTSNHRSRWMYTWFMAVVFIVLGIALYADIARLVS